MPDPGSILHDSITQAGPQTRGRVAICGSHGGGFAGAAAAAAGVRAVIFNDAGLGLDRAGVAGVEALGAAGIAAAAAAHDSARIGDAADMAARGRISTVNGPAAALGLSTGQPVREAAALLATATLQTSPRLDTTPETRSTRRIGTRDLVLIDSVSLLAPEDAGRIVITGSHGGLVGGRPESAARVDAAFLAFSDAGGGADGAGFTRLPVLEARGIAAVTVAHDSARIGEAASILATGVISDANAPARAAGFVPGRKLKDCLAALGEGRLPRER